VIETPNQYPNIGERDGLDALPELHCQGKPRRNRQAHSPQKAITAITKIHHQSRGRRSTVEKDSPCPAVWRVTGRTRNSSE
jgi:hypothetical protein